MSLDSRNVGLTLLVALLVISLITSVLVGGPRFAGLGLGLSAMLVIALGLSWAMSPRALVVLDRELCVERRAWTPVRIQLEAVETAESLERLRRGLRLFGVGGFFGSYGLFWNETLGRFLLYATRRGPALLVRRKGRALPLVVTPNDVPGAIAAIESIGAIRRQ